MKSLAVAAFVLAGCNLYFGSDDDQPCPVFEGDFAPNELRDPATGTCQPFGFPCDGQCGPCAETAQPTPDWGACFSQCEQLDEPTCIATAGCRTAYNANSTIDIPPSFLGCWAIAPSGPDPSTCEGLDAYQCSRHDNCSAFYDDTGLGLQFSSCKAESPQGCFGDQDCGAGAHCSTSDGECLPPPGCDPSTGQACPAVCFGRCVMDQDSCANIDCGPGSHCEQQCSGNGTCGPTCVPDQNACTPESCPAGYECVQTCGTSGGCETCTISCQPSGTCEGIQSEATCVSRADCTPVYQGDNCTCYPNAGCTCEILTYERCEPAP